MEVLPKRFQKYNLELHPDKTKVINLNSKRGEGKRSFDFLGFTHYLSESRNGKIVLKRKTSSKKLILALNKIQDWIKGNRHRPLKELIYDLNGKLRGRYNYYGITFNMKGISWYYVQVKRTLQKWLNRRGGKRSRTGIGTVNLSPFGYHYFVRRFITLTPRRNLFKRNRMREIRSYGSVRER